MSRKHFIQLAAGIAKIANAATRKQMAELVANVSASANPKFDRARFLKACGVA